MMAVLALRSFARMAAANAAAPPPMTARSKWRVMPTRLLLLVGLRRRFKAGSFGDHLRGCEGSRLRRVIRHLGILFVITGLHVFDTVHAFRSIPYGRCTARARHPRAVQRARAQAVTLRLL